MSDDKIDMIYDLLKADRDEASDFRKQVREAHITTKSSIVKLEAQGEIQNQQLSEHMRRTEVSDSLHMSNEGKSGVHENRIVKLEEPAKVMIVLKKWLIGLGAVTGSTVAIAKFLGLF